MIESIVSGSEISNPFFFRFWSAFQARCASSKTTTLVSMPKAAVNEYNRLEFRQNNVGISGQTANVQPESVAGTMQQ
jgi:hypothetical protein